MARSNSYSDLSELVPDREPRHSPAERGRAGTPTLGDHADWRVTPGTALTPLPAPSEVDLEEDVDGEVDPYLVAGTRGASPTPLEDTRADQLERRGAIYDGEWVTVLEAHTTGTDTEGFLIGEATIQRTPFDDPEHVPYAELALPNEKYAKALAKRHRVTTASVPEYYATELEKRQEVIEACPIDVYCSSVSQAWGWPHKLMSYYEARPGAAETCETLMIDSGVNRWGSPQDVLAAAAKTDADYVFATDVTGMEDPSNRDHNDAMPSPDDDGIEDTFDAALEGIRRFMERARELGIADRVVLPVQPDYLEFIDACEQRGFLADVEYVAIGGLLTIPSVEERIEALRAVRERLGDEYRIHALAPGTEPEMLWALRENPGLVDSLDVSTPEQCVGNDKVPDVTWNQDRHAFPRGTHASTVRSAFTVGIALQLTQMLSPLCNAEKTWEYIESQLEEDGDSAAESAESGDTQAMISEWAADD